MKLVDTNVLLYADDEESVNHEASSAWLEGALDRNETLLVPWVSAIGYLRISTHRGI